MKIIRTLFLAGFFIAMILFQFFIWRGDSLSLQQKLVSSLFSWIIPCIWIMVILSIERTTRSDKEIKKTCLFYRFTFALN
jgi:hypothetical protein